jgi:hypothetical protein
MGSLTIFSPSSALANPKTTEQEFLKVLLLLTAGMGKPIAGDLEEAKVRSAVYHVALAEFDEATLTAAAWSLLRKKKWHAFPVIADISEAALELLEKPEDKITPEEAWEACYKAVRRFGHRMRQGDPTGEREGLASLPENVRAAMRSFGWQRMCDVTPEQKGTAFAHFVKTFQNIRQREQREKMVPNVAKQIVRQVATDMGEKTEEALGRKANAIAGRVGHADGVQRIATPPATTSAPTAAG